MNGWIRYVALLMALCLNAQAALADRIVLGMGCFWGAEMRMAKLAGVIDVESGYASGNGTSDRAREHDDAEVVLVVFDPAQVSLEAVLAHFWENHDPTQGDRQGNDIGSHYRSAIFTGDEIQMKAALATRDAYQAELTKAGYGRITTEIAPLKAYRRAEEHHQKYLKKNPRGYCGLGGTGVPYRKDIRAASGSRQPDKPDPVAGLNFPRQLVVFEAEDCAYCRQFKADVLDHWKSEVPIMRTFSVHPPVGWTLEKALFATPTIVLFEKGKEVSRFTGYNGDKPRFWKWLGFHLLSPEQQRIAFEQGTERPGSGSHLDEKRSGTFVDPITGEALFRSDAKFNSGTGWPSFFNPLPGAITEHVDTSHGMRRVEIRSASSGIHLGHVFDDGPPPTGKRYCINGNVLRFVPDNVK